MGKNSGRGRADDSLRSPQMSSAVQVCWEKATRYFEIEEKLVYCTPDRYVIDPEETVNLVDENTIGICAILGTTYGWCQTPNLSTLGWQARPRIIAQPKGPQLLSKLTSADQ